MCSRYAVVVGSSTSVSKATARTVRLQACRVRRMVDKKDRESRAAIPAGVGLIFGAGIGTVLFALTSNPVWIGLGAGLGIIFGGGFARRR
jgi:hypothetical protein